jgi:hypothetical protein
VIEKQQRLESANQLIQSIAGCGRKFFYHKGNVSRFELDKSGRVWFVDGYNGARIYTHYAGRWHGFSEGGTLRGLVIALRDYITHGNPIGFALGPFPDWYSGGDPWGYGADMKTVYECAVSTGIVKTDMPLGQ